LRPLRPLGVCNSHGEETHCEYALSLHSYTSSTCISSCLSYDAHRHSAWNNGTKSHFEKAALAGLVLVPPNYTWLNTLRDSIRDYGSILSSSLNSLITERSANKETEIAAAASDLTYH
jgi:hypothetical protein